MKEAFQNLGQHLRSARSRWGLSQDELAVRCGLTQAHISYFERGERQPTLAQLARLAEVLQVSLQWFLSGDNYPGTDWRDLAVELHSLGIVDLWIEKPLVPGAFRPPEQLVALAVSGEQPEPRVVEAIPAVLAWNVWNVRLLEAYGQSYDVRAASRLAWLADVVCTLQAAEGFPGGCKDPLRLAEYVRSVSPSATADSLGYPVSDGRLPPVSRRWNITYAADLATFRRRAEHLHSLRVPPGDRDARTEPSSHDE